MTTTEKTKWVIDSAHSEISFRVKHLMISNVKGVFKEFRGSVTTKGDEPLATEIEFSLNPSSIDTGAADRDTHLRSADFFDVEKFSSLTFRGTGIKKGDEAGNYILNGDLTIKGVSNNIKLNVEFGGKMKDPWGNEKAGYTLVGKINRKDWGLNWNAAIEAGGVLVSEEVTINCDIQLLKQA
ncbi:MAG: YceI family protein [Bacteroidia bacterium]|nr:YceI family protein [Bacteroidia bacterium]